MLANRKLSEDVDELLKKWIRQNYYNSQSLDNLLDNLIGNVSKFRCETITKKEVTQHIKNENCSQN